MTDKYLTVTDYLQCNGGACVADEIQSIIDNNPNRTIFFPDGEYILSKPIMTPAAPEKSVSLLLSNYAHIKASDDWKSEEAMIRLGGKNPENDNKSPGSNYGLEGGIIDGNGVAVAISVDSGRETFVRNTSIKNAKIGLYIKHGANNGSSDCDISGLNMTGTGERDSVGILARGFDNTFSNIRMYMFFVGVRLESSGNMLRNVHPLYGYGNEETDKCFEESIAFCDCNGNNFYDFCYSDQFATGFYIKKSCASTFQNCWCFYYSERGAFHRAFCAEESFDCLVMGFKADFKEEQRNNIILSEGKSGGKGVISNLRVREELVTDDRYKRYLQGKII